MHIKSSIILLLLSFYGLATTISMITYIIKYNNCNNKNVNTNNIDNTENIYETMYLKNRTYQEILDLYDIYNNADFYNKYDLIDEFNDNIIIYSRDLKNCYASCENMNDCFAFTKYNNYCYLKGKYDLKEKTNNSKSILIVKKNIEFNKTIPIINAEKLITTNISNNEKNTITPINLRS